MRIQSNTYSGEESLDEYIRVGSPGTRVVVISLFLIFAAVLLWGFVGKLPVTKEEKALIIDQDTVMTLSDGKTIEALDPTQVKDENIGILCFISSSDYSLDKLNNFEKKVVIRTPNQEECSGVITSILPVPVSAEVAKTYLLGSQWITDQCVEGDYSWVVIVDPDHDLSAYNYQIANLTFTVEEVSPIQLLIQ